MLGVLLNLLIRFFYAKIFLSVYVILSNSRPRPRLRVWKLTLFYPCNKNNKKNNKKNNPSPKSPKSMSTAGHVTDPILTKLKW